MKCMNEIVDQDVATHFVIKPCVLIFNELGQVLVVRNQDGNWDLPSGILNENPSLVQFLSQCVYEQTGLIVEEAQYVHAMIKSNEEKNMYTLIALFVSYQTMGRIKNEINIRYMNIVDLPTTIQEVITSYLNGSYSGVRMHHG
ncbi:hypothetical protein IC620_07580 [Hazenella sp. IB182357]|uniref:Nudix hydrolase domain-containing protein n=1 Tax=Polycladospora coralii TaxID=2771432 RepID=A0A926RTX3_9BACL|nr:hypothetical protein [Polycladospora coralii]MBD1372223.1 hypothetical protein [Polycladospora coralii]MBS7530722.1 hypothetical protein [Polycladospora coralii]